MSLHSRKPYTNLRFRKPELFDFTKAGGRMLDSRKRRGLSTDRLSKSQLARLHAKGESGSGLWRRITSAARAGRG